MLSLPDDLSQLLVPTINNIKQSCSRFSKALYQLNMVKVLISILAVSKSAHHRVHPGATPTFQLADSFQPP